MLWSHVRVEDLGEKEAVLAAPPKLANEYLERGSARRD
jgi:hypothetical protein